MKFLCEKNILLEALVAAQRASVSSQLLHTVDSILVQAEDTLKILGNNLEIAVEYEVPASVQVPGSVAVNAKKICEIVRRMPEGLIEWFVNDQLNINIKCKEADFDIMGLPGEDYPEIPEFEGTCSFGTTSEVLSSLIRHTSFAVSQNDSKPVLTGMKMELENSSLKLIAVDGYRLAMKSEKIGDTGLQLHCIIPGRSMSDLLKIMKAPDELTVSIGTKHILFTFGGCKFLSRLLDGEFINYSNILPTEEKYVAVLPTAELLLAIERIALIADDSDVGKTPVKLKFKDDKLVLSCATQKGRVTDILEVASNFEEDFEMGFNHRFLLDALRAAEVEQVKLLLTSPINPVVIKPTDDNADAFLYIVLPVRLRS